MRRAETYCSPVPCANGHTEFYTKGKTCAVCSREAVHKHLRTPRGCVQQMLRSARKRAKWKGVPFALTAKDIYIPATCPVFGIPLVVGDSYAAPSLDRHIPDLGYVPGNVEVMSNLANRMKLDATPEMIHDLSEYLKIKALLGKL